MQQSTKKPGDILFEQAPSTLTMLENCLLAFIRSRDSFLNREQRQAILSASVLIPNPNLLSEHLVTALRNIDENLKEDEILKVQKQRKYVDSTFEQQVSELAQKFSQSLEKLEACAKPPQQSVVASCLLARMYEDGVLGLLGSHPLKALHFYKSVCALVSVEGESFLAQARDYALSRIIFFAPHRPGATYYLMDYYFHRGNFSAADFWCEQLADVCKDTDDLKRWYQSNQYFLKRAQWHIAEKRTVEATADLCACFVNNPENREVQQEASKHLISLSASIQQEPLCAVSIIHLLSTMIQTEVFRVPFINHLLDHFDLRNFFTDKKEKKTPPNSLPKATPNFFSSLIADLAEVRKPETLFDLSLASLYLMIANSDQESFDRFKERLKNMSVENDRPREGLKKFNTVLDQDLDYSIFPRFLREQLNFKTRIVELATIVSASFTL